MPDVSLTPEDIEALRKYRADQNYQKLNGGPVIQAPAGMSQEKLNAPLPEVAPPPVDEAAVRAQWESDKARQKQFGGPEIPMPDAIKAIEGQKLVDQTNKLAEEMKRRTFEDSLYAQGEASVKAQNQAKQARPTQPRAAGAGAGYAQPSEQFVGTNPVYRNTPEAQAAYGMLQQGQANQLKGFENMSRAQLEEARNMAAEQAKQNAQLRKVLGSQQLEREAAKNEEADQLEKLRSAVNDQARVANPDPAEYWGGLGFLGSILMIAADSVDKAQAVNLNRPAENYVEKGIDRSLKLQEAAYNRAKDKTELQNTLYNQLRRKNMDAEQARQAYKAAKMEEASTYLQDTAAKTGDKKLAASLQMQSGQLTQEAARNWFDAYGKMPQGGMGKYVRPQVGGSAASVLDPRRKQLVLDGKLDVSALSPAERKEFDAQLETQKKMKSVKEDDKTDSTSAGIKKDIADYNTAIDGINNAIKRSPGTFEAGLSKIPFIGPWLAPEVQKEQDRATAIHAPIYVKTHGAINEHDKPEVPLQVVGRGLSHASRVEAMREYRDNLVKKRDGLAAVLDPKAVSKFNTRRSQEEDRSKVGK